MAHYPHSDRYSHLDGSGPARTRPDDARANRFLPPLDDGRTRARAFAEDPGDGAGEESRTNPRGSGARSREMGSRMYAMVQRAAKADGADKSGLTALTWPVVAAPAGALLVEGLVVVTAVAPVPAPK